MYTRVLTSTIGVIFSLSSTLLQAQSLSASEAASKAQEFTGGRVLKVKPPRGNSTDYLVRVLLPEGRVRQIMVDGDSGETRFRKKTGRPLNNPLPNESPELMRGFNHAPASR